jgi:glycerophosphoryl diester phosphodiesterase
MPDGLIKLCPILGCLLITGYNMAQIVKYIAFALTILLLSTGCNKIKYYPDKEFDGSTTRFLAHRGGGGTGFPENSINGIENGLSKLDGVEVDIQISKDGTIWLSHNNIIESCDKDSGKCFSQLTDQEILNVDICDNANYTYTRLENVFEIMSVQYPGSYISLDVKAWSPCNSDEWNILSSLKKLANVIVELSHTYKLESKVMVESETAEFLDYVKDGNSNIKCYLTAFGDFERGMLKALENGYDGISFEYKFDEEINAQHVELLHKKGLKIQLWTVNTESDLDEAISLKPDFIQTDNITYTSQLKSKEAE